MSHLNSTHTIFPLRVEDGAIRKDPTEETQNLYDSRFVMAMPRSGPFGTPLIVLKSMSFPNKLVALLMEMIALETSCIDSFNGGRARSSGVCIP
jgi:hypothetical protein